MTASSLRDSDGLPREVDYSADSVLHRRTRLMVVNWKVRDESMRVNTEFDAIEDVPSDYTATGYRYSW